MTELGIHVFDADVTSDKDTQELLNKIEGMSGGRLDVLVNNAYVFNFSTLYNDVLINI